VAFRLGILMSPFAQGKQTPEGDDFTPEAESLLHYAAKPVM
jgi:hypothetical protein